MDLSTKQTDSDLDADTGVGRWEGRGEGWPGSLGLADANYYTENG